MNNMKGYMQLNQRKVLGHELDFSFIVLLFQNGLVDLPSPFYSFILNHGLIHALQIFFCQIMLVILSSLEE